MIKVRTIIQKVDLACDTAGIKRAELARRMNTSESALKQKLDRGKLSQDELCRIASLIGCEYSSAFIFSDGTIIK